MNLAFDIYFKLESRKLFIREKEKERKREKVVYSFK